MLKNPIICALDTTDVDKASTLASSLKGNIGAIKLGLEFFTHNGAAGVQTLEKIGIPIFLDLKFHDIPNTVAGAIRGLANLNIFMTTVHISGGKRMMEAAAEAIKETFKFSTAPAVVGVTVLTSLDKEDLQRMTGNLEPIETSVIRLASLAKQCGLNGVVCSPHEIEKVREKCGPGFKLVVPGIRPQIRLSDLLVGGGTQISRVNNDDQKRTMTPREAIEKGADYLVIGRPITAAPHPKDAAQAILASLD